MDCSAAHFTSPSASHWSTLGALPTPIFLESNTRPTTKNTECERGSVCVDECQTRQANKHLSENDSIGNTRELIGREKKLTDRRYRNSSCARGPMPDWRVKSSAKTKKFFSQGSLETQHRTLATLNHCLNNGVRIILL